MKKTKLISSQMQYKKEYFKWEWYRNQFQPGVYTNEENCCYEEHYHLVENEKPQDLPF